MVRPFFVCASPAEPENEYREEKARDKACGVDPDVHHHRAAPGEDLDGFIDDGGKQAKRRAVEQIAPMRGGAAVRIPEQTQKCGAFEAEQSIFRKMRRLTQEKFVNLRAEQFVQERLEGAAHLAGGRAALHLVAPDEGERQGDENAERAADAEIVPYSSVLGHFNRPFRGPHAVLLKFYHARVLRTMELQKFNKFTRLSRKEIRCGMLAAVRRIWYTDCI